MIISGCSSSAVEYSKDINTKNKILSNQSLATNAQKEYEALQETRKNE
jgi:hypothetical protein